MDERAVLSLLQSLAQLDIDAVNAYRRALRRIEDGPVRDEIEGFRRDHERHVEELSAAIEKRGGKRPAFEPDTAGALIEGLTALRSTGETGALKALKTNERLTNAAYAAAIREDLPSDVALLVQKNREDERRHFNFIRAELDRPEHHGIGFRGLLAGAAVLAGAAAVTVWAVTRRRTEKVERARPEPDWLVHHAGPDTRTGEAVTGADQTHRSEVSDFGDEAQLQMPGEPANLTVHPRRYLDEARRRDFDEAAKKSTD
jgi:rubrerythrin